MAGESKAVFVLAKEEERFVVSIASRVGSTSYRTICVNRKIDQRISIDVL